MERDPGAAVATFLAEQPLVPGGTVALGAGEAHHARVRRLAVGMPVRVTDGTGRMAQAVLLRLSRGEAVVEVQRVERVARPSPVHLLLPVGDRDRMLLLAEKATELALTSWRPVRWHRSRSVGPRGEGVAFRSRVQARMAAALTQSGGAWLPEVHPEALPERATAAAPDGVRVLLDVLGGAMPPTDARPVVLAVGPEGGVTPEERSHLLAAGFLPVKVAPLTLRFETAAIAALAVVRARCPMQLLEEPDG